MILNYIDFWKLIVKGNRNVWLYISPITSSEVICDHNSKIIQVSNMQILMESKNEIL
jgi:hypothetical protein